MEIDRLKETVRDIQAVICTFKAAGKVDHRGQEWRHWDQGDRAGSKAILIYPAGPWLPRYNCITQPF